MSNPTLTLTPFAWFQWHYFRDLVDTEIGGFALTETEDPLLVTRLCLVAQQCDYVTCELLGDEKGGTLDHLDHWTSAPHNLVAGQCTRIWWHTHPKMSANPSGTDEATFRELFSSAPWGIMMILSKTDDVYARLSVSTPTPHQLKLDVSVNWLIPPMVEPQEAINWQAQVKELVRPMPKPIPKAPANHPSKKNKGGKQTEQTDNDFLASAWANTLREEESKESPLEKLDYYNSYQSEEWYAACDECGEEWMIEKSEDEESCPHCTSTKLQFYVW